MKNILKVILFILGSSIYVSASCIQDKAQAKQLFNMAKVKHEYTEVYAFLQSSCNKKCFSSCNFLGILYNASIPGNTYYNVKNAYDVFLEACNSGFAKSCTNIAKLQNISNNEKKYYLEKALKMEDKSAYYQLGKLYDESKEYHTAIKMHQKACKSKIIDSCVILAKIYHDGIYVSKSNYLADIYSKMAGYDNYRALKYMIK